MTRARGEAGSFAAALAVWYLVMPSPAAAGAWTRAAGEGQAIITLSHYVATDRFDRSGNRTRQSRFAKTELRTQIEYGLSDPLTIGIKPTYQYVKSHVNGGEPHNRGLSDAELYLRTRLWRSDNAVLSIQPLVKLPVEARDGETPSLGHDQTDVELRLLFGYGAGAGPGSWYVNVEAGPRKRFEAPSDEFRIDGALGYRPDERWLLLVESFNTISFRNGSTGGLVQTAAPDYDLHKLQFSAVRRITDALWVQAGAFVDVAGDDVGAGQGAILALWVSF